MKIILLSGGSGKRLWPLTNELSSKQFLKVLKTKDNKLESMIQRVWKQLKEANLQESTYIATSQAQTNLVLDQLGTDNPLIVEPQQMDTFPAIALASAYLHSCLSVNPEEVVCVLPVDPFVEKDFFEHLKILENLVKENSASIALMGGIPTYPSEKYGYIVPGRELKKSRNISYLTVQSFIEKPKEDDANLLLQLGALWNLGVFAFKLKFMVTLMQNKGMPVLYDDLIKIYGTLPKISFDYEVLEEVDHAVVIPFKGKWKDLGTWNTLTEEMDTNLLGKGYISEDSTNTHVINKLEIPVTVISLSNILVASSPQGILVSDKASSYKIKEIMSKEKERPMFEERKWGTYEILNYTKYSNCHEVLTKKIVIHAGKSISYQYHLNRSEVWTILSGTGEFALEDRLYDVSQGDVLKIPKGAKHGIKANSTLEIIEVQMGSELSEDDIIRLFLTWEEVLKHCKR